MIECSRKRFFAWLKRDNPNPQTELKYNSNFEMLIAVILSTQATDVSVNKATAQLYKVVNTPHSILRLGGKKLKKHIQTIALFNTKTKNILKTCDLLLDKYEGQVPNYRKSLESLPGVGRKTVNVIEVERNLLKRIPQKYLLNAHH